MSELPSLNPAQREAVEHATGPALVLAGAGSGKTRVLTARVARLLERGADPRELLAFTFTNRAAREMRARIERAAGDAGRALWIGTFHATAVRLLRREAATLGLPAGFTIWDREDQESLVREIVRELGLPDAAYRTGHVLARISDAKNALVGPGHAARAAATDFERRIADVYARYQSALRRAGALDFDDLIAESVRLFVEHPDAAARWQRRFAHVLVDEYQDTNHAQFRLVQSLSAQGAAGGPGSVVVVGDDDQSIYGWRGADLSNVLDFERAFPGAVVIRLEQNYRSTRTILAAANAVIAHNRSRKGKTLWSEREAGPPVTFALCADEADEAARVRRWLEDGRRAGRGLSACAVLVRTNSQTRAFETEWRRAGIPYEIVGGVSFFQRREVKDVLAYLRLAVNPADTASFFRAWNTPRRGLGATVESLVRARLASGAPTPAAALRALLAEGALRGPGRTGAIELLGLLDELAAGAATTPPERLLALALERTGYLERLEADDPAELADRRANVEELVVGAAQFAASGRGGLLEWLSECALLTDADRVHGGERVLLLTAHNAKGLEFDAVAVAGLEEGLFPHASALEDADELEEERRLFYVALTRARNEVLLCAAAWRRRFTPSSGGFTSWGGQVSRFVDEIPGELLAREDRSRAAQDGRAHGGHGPSRARTGARRGGGADAPSDLALDDDALARGPWPAGRGANARRAIGRLVVHDTFGRGTVVDADGDGPDMKLTVRFAGSVKKVYARFVTGGDDGDQA